MTLKRFFISLFVVMYVYATVTMPVLGYDDSSKAADAYSGSQSTVTDTKAAGASNDSGSEETVQNAAESSADQEAQDADRNADSSGSDQDSAGSDADSSTPVKGSDQDSSAAVKDSNQDSSSADKDSGQDSEFASSTDTEKEEPKDVPFSSSKISGAGVYVHASAKAGVLPEGTTMRLNDVSSYRAETAANQVLSEDVQSAQGVDISFYNAKGKEIEPEGNVNVSMRLVDSLEGQDFSVIHVSDSGAAEKVGSASSTGASFSSDEFSLYVLAGTGSQKDPYDNVYREYTIGFGETITLYSDEKNPDGTWIPGAGKSAWNFSDINKQGAENLAEFKPYRGTAYVQPKVIITAKQKAGTLRCSFNYTHPKDQTHKTVTGEFTATHYYLIHIVDKSKNEYSVQFRNNDGSGPSYVTADMLKYSKERDVKVERTVNNEYVHTFTFEEPVNPSSRKDKVTLVMPDYPKENEKIRTKGNQAFKFIGWSVLDKANPTTGNKESIVYPFTDAHVFAPGDRFPLDRKDLILWAVWARIDTPEKPGLTANFYLRIDDHIPNEPQSHGDASYTQIGQSNTYKLPLACFKTDSVNGVDEGWEEGVNKPFAADVFTSLKNAGKLPADVTDADEFNAHYRVVWSTIKKENEGWHVDGILYSKDLYNLAYHENGDLVVVSSMPEGVKDIPEGETTMVDKLIPDRYDRVFTGWNTKANGEGVSFKPGDTVVVSSHPDLDKSINTLHLYAQWEKSTKYSYEVRYLEAGTNRVLKAPEFFGDQILGNKISSKEVSLRATSSIVDSDSSFPKGHYVFSYADPAIGDGDGGLIIGEDNSKNVITLYYMRATQYILATSVSLHKTDDLGKPLKDAEFELTKQGGEESAVFKSDNQGNLQIPFTKDPESGSDDTLIYTLKESKAPEGHIKSDDEYTIKIKRGEPTEISFPGSKTKKFYPLIATVLKNGVETDSGNITVENKAIIEPIDLPITATKVLEGRAQLAGEFKFSLTDKEGKPVSKAVNTADGQVIFDGVVAKEPGTYEFNISEDTGNDNAIQYDKSVYSVKVDVVRGDDNVLRISDMTYTKDGESATDAVFNNKAKFNITYDLNGGSYNGETADINEQYLYGTEILIHEAPTRKGYKFLYWKGSAYQPGDKYVVRGDHRFVAQWELVKNDTDNNDDDSDKDSDITPDNESDYGDGKNYSNDPAKISKGSQKNHPNSSKLSGAANTGAANTGDVTGITSLVILFILSGALLIAVGLTKRKTSR